MNEPRYQPFSNGAQYMDWEGSNCERCTKFPSTPAGWIRGRCVIADAVNDAYWGDGTVSAAIARRMGYLANEGRHCWMCPEVQWTEAWLQEWQLRHPVEG